MDTIIKRMQKNIIFQAVLSILLGLVLLIWPTTTITTIVYLIAIFMCLHAFLDFIAYFKNNSSYEPASNSLISGIFFALVGVIMFIFPKHVASLISIILGIIILLSSILKMVRAMEYKKLGGNSWLFPLIASIVTAIAGILIIINPFPTALGLVVLSGIILIAMGIADIVTVIMFGKLYKEYKKTNKL